MGENFGNLMFWSWNGKMESDEIERQILSFARTGGSGFFIHARAGLKISYMGERWFSAIEGAVECARRLGLEVWLYDEDGWPSGFAGGAVPGCGEAFWSKSLWFGEEVPENGRVIAKFRRTAEGYVRDPEGRDLTAYALTDRHYADLLHPEAVRCFIQNTHEVYKKRLGRYFGRTVRGIFTDEPQVSCGHAWSEILPREFEKRYGYSLLDQLWKLHVEESRSSLRFDYNRLISELMEENFTKPISRWCRENGLIFTGHLSGEDSICMQVGNSGGVSRHYEYMQMPGIDHLGRRLVSPLTLRQISGVKNQLEIPQVLSETFGCSGWNVSFPQLCWLWAEQAVSGINRACLHLSAYTVKGIRKRDYPAFFSYQEPWWERFGALSQWMRGLNAFLSRGKCSARVGVISAVVGCWSEPMYGETQRRMSNQLRVLIEGLTDCQIDFDLIDEAILARHGSAEDGKLVVGRARYEYVIIADTEGVLSRTAETLLELSRQGGRLIFCNRPPELADGRRCDLSRRLGSAGVGLPVQNRRDLWRKFFESERFTRKAEMRSEYDGHLTEGLFVALREEGGETLCAVFNPSTDSEKRGILGFSGRGTIAEFHPGTGEKEALETLPGPRSSARIGLKPMECRCFVLSEEELHFRPTGPEIRAELTMASVRRLDENALTLDYARFSADGSEFSEPLPITDLQDKIFSLAERDRRAHRVLVKFEFRIGTMPKRLSLVWEYEDCRALTVNGKPILPPDDSWWLDRCMRRAEIGFAAYAGVNEIIMEYEITPMQLTFDLDEVYETARNRFFYPSEPESVYLLGDFDLSAVAAECGPNWYGVNGDFVIGEPAEKRPDLDLTPQGMWFYRGAAVYRTTFEGRGVRTFLELDKFEGALVTVTVNGREAGEIFSPSLELEITGLAGEGLNEVEFTLWSGNRNLLGPHHHYRGEIPFVGVNSFKGVRGYEDSIVNFDAPARTWTDRYAFVPFGLGRCYLRMPGGSVRSGEEGSI